MSIPKNEFSSKSPSHKTPDVRSIDMPTDIKVYNTSKQMDSAEASEDSLFDEEVY